MGLFTNLLNPKAAVLYLSLLPQFADPATGPVLPQLLVLGLTQMAVSITINGAIILSAARIAAFLLHRPGWQRAQRWLTGSVLGLLAMRMAVGATTLRHRLASGVGRVLTRRFPRAGRDRRVKTHPT